MNRSSSRIGGWRNCARYQDRNAYKKNVILGWLEQHNLPWWIFHNWIFPSSQSSSSRAVSTDFPNSLSPSVPIVQRSWQLLQSSSCVHPGQILAGRLTLARPSVELYKKTSRLSSSLLLQLCPACLVRITWMVLKMTGKWLYSHSFVRSCFKDMFIQYNS